MNGMSTFDLDERVMDVDAHGEMGAREMARAFKSSRRPKPVSIKSLTSTPPTNPRSSPRSATEPPTAVYCTPSSHSRPTHSTPTFSARRPGAGDRMGRVFSLSPALMSRIGIIIPD